MASVPPSEFTLLATDLEARFVAGLSPWTEDDFADRALSAFRHQFANCAPYRAFCERKGVTPQTVSRWEDIPPVPATAFKYFDFRSDGRECEVDATFLTSGTSRGIEARGRHLVPRLDLYRAALLEPFRASLLPDRDKITFLSLIPSPDEVPDSSLSFMVGEAAERLADDSYWLVDGAGNLSDARMREAAVAARERAEPVLVLGTALSFAHLIERASTDGGRPGLRDLPPGSRVMETGGFKGARRVVSRSELYDGISGHTGIPVGRIVNEYGMTELLSQLYEPVLTKGAKAVGEHVPPPWLRVRALDPISLDPVREGAEGILTFFDLANLGSVSHVLTEDVGSVTGGRVRLRGRAAGAEPRGCSRAMDELMAAAGGS